MFRAPEVKKLVSVLAASMLMTDTREEVLEYVSCIYYLVWFKRAMTQVWTLINSKSEVNIIHLTFAKQLGLSIRPTDIRVQNINSTTLDIYEIVVAVFSIVDKAN